MKIDFEPLHHNRNKIYFRFRLWADYGAVGWNNVKQRWFEHSLNFKRVFVGNKNETFLPLPCNHTMETVNTDVVVLYKLNYTNFLNGPFTASFFFISSYQYSWQETIALYISLSMTGFEPRTSGIASNHSTNWATTTARYTKLNYVVTPSCSLRSFRVFH